MKTHVWDKEKSQVRLLFIKIRPVFAVWNSAVDNNARHADLLFFWTKEDWVQMQFVHWFGNHRNKSPKPIRHLVNANDTENSNHK